MGNPDFTADLSDVEEKFRAVYERGREHGRLEERERIGRLLRAPTDFEAGKVVAMAAIGPPPSSKPSGRVAPGTIRPIVQEVLAAEAGLTKAEITRRVVARNPGIAAPSISNELSRNEKAERTGLKLYRRTRGGRWYLNDVNDVNENDGLPETEGPAVAANDRPAGSMLNGSHVDERPIETSGPGE